MLISPQENIKRIGIIGTGFIGRGLAMALEFVPDLEISRVYTRRLSESSKEYPYPNSLSDSLNDVIEYSDLLVECSGDVRLATEVVHLAFQADRPVVTMNAEFQITTGSFFIGKGLLSEAEGDQPGCLAALNRELTAMGFEALVYGNIKGFLNPNPELTEMQYWARKQGISLPQVTAFTDGSKVEIEQALVANGLKASLLPGGMVGKPVNSLKEGVDWLQTQAMQHKSTLSDYLLLHNSAAHIFILARHKDPRQAAYLKYLKLGEGPNYLFSRNYHLCHLEIVKSIQDIFNHKRSLLNNSSHPRYSIASIAKIDLPAGCKIKRGLGSQYIRGRAIEISQNPDHLPIGLADDICVSRKIKAGEILRFEDVEVPDSRALSCWNHIQRRLKDHL